MNNSEKRSTVQCSRVKKSSINQSTKVRLLCSDDSDYSPQPGKLEMKGRCDSQPSREQITPSSQACCDHCRLIRRWRATVSNCENNRNEGFAVSSGQNVFHTIDVPGWATQETHKTLGRRRRDTSQLEKFEQRRKIFYFMDHSLCSGWLEPRNNFF